MIHGGTCGLWSICNSDSMVYTGGTEAHNVPVVLFETTR